MKLPTLTQTFNDGILHIYSVENIAESGNLPKDRLKAKISNLRYSERVVGMVRYWTAFQNQIQINQMVRTQRIDSVNVHDVAVLNGKYYDIVQIQYVQDVEPACMDLSLERLETEYEIK
jgi:hypothetical protein